MWCPTNKLENLSLLGNFLKYDCRGFVLGWVSSLCPVSRSNCWLADNSSAIDSRCEFVDSLLKWICKALFQELLSEIVLYILLSIVKLLDSRTQSYDLHKHCLCFKKKLRRTHEIKTSTQFKWILLNIFQEHNSWYIFLKDVLIYLIAISR